jgi:flagellar M-ring protein FliF
MEKLRQIKKIGIILALTVAIFGAIFTVAYFNRVKYAVLFSNLDTSDSASIINALKTDKVSYKVQGTSILVPENQVDELRISVLSNGNVSSEKGWSLFDQNQFGVTDTEEKVMYQRALQDELAKTIESFDEVDKARVHLVLPDDTVFAKDNSDKASASVTLKLKGTSTLDEGQVKAIIALVSGSVKNLPKENVQVIDSNMNLLSDNVYDGTDNNGLTSASKQQILKNQFESGLQNDVKKMLEAVFGSGKVSVKVNADLDFDSQQITTIKYDKDKVIRSQSISKESSNDSSGSSTSASPVDNNMSNTTSSGSSPASNTSKDDETTNYEIGQTEDKTVKAPGEVKRMTVSVIIDGNLDDTEKTQIQNIVSAATGYDATRGDQINIEALPFNTDIQNQAQKDLQELNADKSNQAKYKLYAIIGGSLLGLLLLFFIIRAIKRKKKKATGEIIEEQMTKPKPGINVVVGDKAAAANVVQSEPVSYQPVLDENDEKENVDTEIRDYANRKPDQVVEIIKTWLSDDER